MNRRTPHELALDVGLERLEVGKSLGSMYGKKGQSVAIIRPQSHPTYLGDGPRAPITVAGQAGHLQEAGALAQDPVPLVHVVALPCVHVRVQ